MRTDKATLAGILAAAALLAHVALPFVHFQFEGDEAQSRTYYPSGLAERENAFDPIAGASMNYAWASIIIFVVGMAAFVGIRYGPQFKHIWYAKAGAFLIALVGTAMVVHSRGLWIGRGVATLVHASLGSDAPAQRFLASGADHYSRVAPISPVLVLLLTAASFWMAGRALTREVSREKRHHQQAKRWMRGTQAVLIGSVLALIVPWASETAEDNSPLVGEQQDTDPFMISLYDAARLHMDSQPLVEETGEAGLSEYDDLASIANASSQLFWVPAILLFLGLLATRLAVDEQKVFSRTMQYITGLLGSLVIALQVIGVVLIGIFLVEANSQVEASPTYAPLLAGLFYGASIIYLIAAVRELGASKDNLVADRFPEPIIYD